MALSDTYIKEILSQSYNIHADEILEKSKSVDTNQQVVRVFDVDSYEVVVVSDPGDNAIVEFFLADDVVEIVSDILENYVFAVSKLDIGRGLISIVNKKLWQFGAIESMSEDELDLLPDYISSINNSIISQLNCTIDTRIDNVVKDLTDLGLSYSNNLALFLNKTEGKKIFELRF
jgi:hypothetical protein